MKYKLSQYGKDNLKRARLSLSALTIDSEIKAGRRKTRGDYMMELCELEDAFAEGWIRDERISSTDFQVMLSQLTVYCRSYRDRIKKAFAESQPNG